MVAKKKSTGGSKVKVNKLKVNKETIKDLGTKESKAIKGGQRGTFTRPSLGDECGTYYSKCCD
jgi:hypothetical protein